jgi:hypothetical protein
VLRRAASRGFRAIQDRLDQFLQSRSLLGSQEHFL